MQVGCPKTCVVTAINNYTTILYKTKVGASNEQISDY